MRLTFIQFAAFSDRWRRLGVTDDDLSRLETSLLANPEAGVVIRGSGGLRKLRFSPAASSKGKSGSLRICYALFPAYARVYFVTLYGKSRQANLTAAERLAIKGLLERFGAALSRGENP
jgi:hypothetical protein